MTNRRNNFLPLKHQRRRDVDLPVDKLDDLNAMLELIARCVRRGRDDVAGLLATQAARLVAEATR